MNEQKYETKTVWWHERVSELYEYHSRLENPMPYQIQLFQRYIMQLAAEICLDDSANPAGRRVLNAAQFLGHIQVFDLTVDRNLQYQAALNELRQAMNNNL
jgi:hypothetical protein